MGLALCVRPGDNETTVSVAGDIDICVERQLREFLVQAALRHGPLLLDMSEVSFMDCTGLGAVLRARWEAESRGGSIRLTGASSAVRRIIELVGTDEIATGAYCALAVSPSSRHLAGSFEVDAEVEPRQTDSDAA
jgi:anti-anti-sigma factor